jgi:hypothetical protein
VDRVDGAEPLIAELAPPSVGRVTSVTGTFNDTKVVRITVR